MSRELLVLLISVQSQQVLTLSQWRANLDRVDLTDQRGDLVPPLTLHRRSLAAGCVLEIEGAQLGQLDVLDQPRRDALQCIVERLVESCQPVAATPQPSAGLELDFLDQSRLPASVVDYEDAYGRWPSCVSAERLGFDTCPAQDARLRENTLESDELLVCSVIAGSYGQAQQASPFGTFRSLTIDVVCDTVVRHRPLLFKTARAPLDGGSSVMRPTRHRTGSVQPEDAKHLRRHTRWVIPNPAAWSDGRSDASGPRTRKCRTLSARIRALLRLAPCNDARRSTARARCRPPLPGCSRSRRSRKTTQRPGMR